jgi:hypothetical protein
VAQEQRLDDRVDLSGLLLEELAHVVEGLQERWPDRALTIRSTPARRPPKSGATTTNRRP